jgi:hypothetical protein
MADVRISKVALHKYLNDVIEENELLLKEVEENKYNLPESILHDKKIEAVSKIYMAKNIINKFSNKKK